MSTPIPQNRCELSIAEIATACDGTILGRADVRTTSVSIDTRTIQPGALFVALRGVTDGHRFIDEAIDRKCAAVVVERGRPKHGIDTVEVDDTLTALGAIARHQVQLARSKRKIPIAAIGGAAGKTTTKELTAAAARALFANLLAT